MQTCDIHSNTIARIFDTINEIKIQQAQFVGSMEISVKHISENVALNSTIIQQNNEKLNTNKEKISNLIWNKKLIYGLITIASMIFLSISGYFFKLIYDLACKAG